MISNRGKPTKWGKKMQERGTNECKTRPVKVTTLTRKKILDSSKEKQNDKSDTNEL